MECTRRIRVSGGISLFLLQRESPSWVAGERSRFSVHKYHIPIGGKKNSFSLLWVGFIRRTGGEERWEKTWRALKVGWFLLTVSFGF